MASFWKHKNLRNSVFMTYLFVFVVLFEFVPQLNQNLQIVSLTNEVFSFNFSLIYLDKMECSKNPMH